MPTPRQHGGTELSHFPLTVPGFRGLNTQARGALLGPEWATRLENTIIDSSGRVGARKGWENVTTSASAESFIDGIEYRKKDGSAPKLVMVSATKVTVSSTNGNTWTDATGTAVFTTGDWYLQNFNDFVIGFQATYKLLVYNGTTSSIITDANCPTSGIGCAAFGRVWGAASDGVTLRYSDLLDHTNWTTGASGSFNMSNVWLDNDHIQGITAFNNLLVVFGSRNIAIWSDTSGSSIGMNPTNMKIVDTIPGVGLFHQRTIQNVSGDLWFVANNLELMSMQRLVVEQKSGNITTLSTHVSDFLRDSLNDGNFSSSRLRSVFSPRDRFYLLSLPKVSAVGVVDEIGSTFCFDTRGQLQDGTARCVGVWNQFVGTSWIARTNGDLYATLYTQTGKIGFYSQSNQDYATSYRMIYESGWLKIAEPYQLILKRLNGLFFFDLTTTVLMKWAWDFSTVFTSKQLTWETGGGNAQWGVSEWNVAEWGGGIDLTGKKVAGSGTGEYIKVGMEAVIDGGQFSVQQIDLLAKVGRIKG